MHKLTMQQIAEAAHVSCATVSRCLSGREGVGEKTRERVLRICRDMGYSPNFTEAAPHRTGRIGLLVPSLLDPETAVMANRKRTLTNAAAMATARMPRLPFAAGSTTARNMP